MSRSSGCPGSLKAKPAPHCTATRHKGMQTTIFATARKLATLVYRMLHWGQDYVDEGEAAYEERQRQRTLTYLKTTA